MLCADLMIGEVYDYVYLYGFDGRIVEVIVLALHLQSDGVWEACFRQDKIVGYGMLEISRLV